MAEKVMFVGADGATKVVELDSPEFYAEMLQVVRDVDLCILDLIAWLPPSLMTPERLRALELARDVLMEIYREIRNKVSSHQPDRYDEMIDTLEEEGF